MKHIPALALLLLSAPALAGSGLPDERHIIVNGHGYVEAVPDIAILHLSIEATAESLLQAKNSVDRNTDLAVKSALKLGVKQDDIAASDIHASPQYDWQQAGRVYRGEQVSRTVDVTLRDISRYGQLVHALIKAGISRINNIEMDFSKRKQLENQALEKAIEDARQKAEVIAKGFGTRPGVVYKINESPQVSIPYAQNMRFQAMEAADVQTEGADSLRVGKQKIHQDIEAVFYLND